MSDAFGARRLVAVAVAVVLVLNVLTAFAVVLCCVVLFWYVVKTNDGRQQCKMQQTLDVEASQQDKQPSELARQTALRAG